MMHRAVAVQSVPTSLSTLGCIVGRPHQATLRRRAAPQTESTTNAAASRGGSWVKDRTAGRGGIGMANPSVPKAVFRRPQKSRWQGSWHFWISGASGPSQPVEPPRPGKGCSHTSQVLCRRFWAPARCDSRHRVHAQSPGGDGQSSAQIAPPRSAVRRRVRGYQRWRRWTITLR